mmetsp:Transcript_47609/g.154649  ORF Transcript_47609/g.154649 Transcript_47609/m.154649 type:complete len:230 (-) Transcript_47609:9-698(-)
MDDTKRTQAVPRSPSSLPRLQPCCRLRGERAARLPRRRRRTCARPPSSRPSNLCSSRYCFTSSGSPARGAWCGTQSARLTRCSAAASGLSSRPTRRTRPSRTSSPSCSPRRSPRPQPRSSGTACSAGGRRKAALPRPARPSLLAQLGRPPAPPHPAQAPSARRASRWRWLQRTPPSTLERWCTCTALSCRHRTRRCSTSWSTWSPRPLGTVAGASMRVRTRVGRQWATR